MTSGKRKPDAPDPDFKTMRRHLTYRTPYGYAIYENYPGHGCYISSVRIDPKHRSQGHARHMFDDFIEAADRAGVNLSVSVAPIKKPAWNELDGDQLTGIAKRRGFKAQPGSVLMRREAVPKAGAVRQTTRGPT